MKRYEITGRPAVPFDILLDNPVGTVVEARLDEDEERMLIDIGAIRVLGDVKPKAAATKAATKK